ncbi:MAG: DUF3078 domain-containing protein [Candidatus Cloacimonetes bacterium]|nr:DUF3078 domain-containing protein [Candidatus Cloacimonadota bacterium]
MKNMILAALLFCLCGMLGAEQWKYSADASFSLAQNFYSEKWAGTELSNINWIANSNSSAEKQLSKIMHDRTTLKLAFGQTHTQKTDALGDKYWEKAQKTTDKIDLESLLRFTLQFYVDPFAAARMESQFMDMSDPAKTRMVNPLKLTETAGIARTFIKDDYQELNSRLGAAFRQNIDRDVLVGTERETQTTNDGGLEFITEYSKKFMPKDVTYKSKLLVYEALFNSKSKDLNDDWKSPDVKWENTLSTKLWSVITMSLIFDVIYEREQVKEIQYKETLALGVSYQLF